MIGLEYFQLANFLLIYLCLSTFYIYCSVINKARGGLETDFEKPLPSDQHNFHSLKKKIDLPNA